MAPIPNRARPAPVNSPRRQRVPPALTRGNERFDGLSILEEHRGDLGLVLWRSARNLALWASTPPERRARLFAGEAASTRQDDLARLKLDAELQAPLSVVAALLQSPAGVDLPRLVNACRRIALWAEQRGFLATAVAYAQAAALAAPETASLAFAVARLARRLAEYDRAESWYTRAVIQARQSGDWRIYALAFSGMGNLAMQKGNFPAARRAQLRCLRTALRHNLTEVLGDAYHDMFVTEIETGAGGEADALAVQAFRVYGPRHPSVPRLAYDVAYHWTLQGFFPGALRVSRALLEHFDAPAERALVLGLVARSAGGVGDRAAYAAATEEAFRLISTEAAQDSAARALLGVTYGAASLGDWARAGEAAERALQLATQRKEGRVLLAAEAALEFVRTRPEPRAPEPVESAGLVEEFVDALRSFPAAAFAR